jgi:hypothetical protein
VIGVAIAVPLLVRASRRRRFEDDLTAVIGEVEWFAGVLIPELQQQPSLERVAGGWQVGQSRVAAAEDTLTGLETSARDESDATRARTMRDAVRAARARIDVLISSPGTAHQPELAAAATELRSALAVGRAEGGEI